MAAFDLHPAELAYALSYAHVSGIIGWDRAAFLPADGAVPGDWLQQGEAALLDAGRLTGDPETGLNFTDVMTRTLLALVDPALVLLAERHVSGGTRRLSVHAKAQDYVGLSRNAADRFDVTRYSDITGAAAACAGYLGATRAGGAARTSFEGDRETFLGIKKACGDGQTETAEAALAALGASKDEAHAAALALGAPDAAGLLSVFYCANGTAQAAETLTVFTQKDAGTWVLVQPAGPKGPMILEQSSAAALTARVSVSIAARLQAGPD